MHCIDIKYCIVHSNMQSYGMSSGEWLSTDTIYIYEMSSGEWLGTYMMLDIVVKLL